MSDTKNGTPVADAETGARARRRQYRTTARVLREYTARLYRIAQVLGDYEDGTTPPPRTGTVPWSVLTAANRYEAIQGEVSGLALYASQMLVHFDFDEAEAAELRIRLFDAEYIVGHIREILKHLAVVSGNKSTRDKIRPAPPPKDPPGRVKL